MKKRYINPNIEVVLVTTTQMIAGSPGQPQDGDAVGPGMSRRHDDWDDDWDDEDDY